MKDSIVGLTLGIRYTRSFRIPDISGEIIDHIIYNDDSPFDSKLFPRIQENSNREKILFHPETNEYLRINTDDIILGIEINEDFDKKYEWLKNDVLSYFQNILFVKFGLKNIKRIGIIFSHKTKKDKKIDEIVKKISANNISDAENVNISFSKKSAAQEGIFRKGVKDFQNTIYNFEDMGESMQVRLDYQYYYEPVVEDLRQCFIKKVLEGAEQFLVNNFYTWLNEQE